MTQEGKVLGQFAKEVGGILVCPTMEVHVGWITTVGKEPMQNGTSLSLFHGIFRDRTLVHLSKNSLQF